MEQELREAGLGPRGGWDQAVVELSRASTPGSEPGRGALGVAESSFSFSSLEEGVADAVCMLQAAFLAEQSARSRVRGPQVKVLVLLRLAEHGPGARRVALPSNQLGPRASG